MTEGTSFGLAECCQVWGDPIASRLDLTLVCTQRNALSATKGPSVTARAFLFQPPMFHMEHSP